MVELYDPQSISNEVNAIKDQDPTSDVCDFLSQPQDFKIDPKQDSGVKRASSDNDACF